MTLTCQVQIVTYNSAAVIADCLSAVLAQSVQATRILVLDNGSDDGTLAIAREIAAGDHEGLVQIRAQASNLGYAGAHNRGFAEALAAGVDTVLTVNPDVLLAPDYLAWCLHQVARALEAGVQLGGVMGKLIRSDGRVLDSTGLVMGPVLHVVDRGADEADRGQYDRAPDVWGICGAAALYTGACLRALHEHDNMVLDEAFFLYKEDVDLCWRARLLGFSFLYAPRAQAVHERGWKRGQAPHALAEANSWANQVGIVVAYTPIWRGMYWLAMAAECVRWLLLLTRRPRTARLAWRLMRERWGHAVRKGRAYRGVLK